MPNTISSFITLHVVTITTRLHTASSGVQIPEKARLLLLSSVNTGYRANPSPYSVGTGVPP